MGDRFDHVVIGAGIYGLYAASRLAASGSRVAVVECESGPFARASFVNQARVHNGYHYPRSFSTAVKSAGYYDRFCREFDFAINGKFRKIYAISHNFSYTSGGEFQRFCANAGIPCEEAAPAKYFRRGAVDAAFETLEYAFDAVMIRDHLESAVRESGRAELIYSARPVAARRNGGGYEIELDCGRSVSAPSVVNCTYAFVNGIQRLFGFDGFPIKYEICEIILCRVSQPLADAGITVMDGPFFSVMPFGLSGLHSLTAVTFTPHDTCYETLPAFRCQRRNPSCRPDRLANCDSCPARPESAWHEMSQIAKKYLRPEASIEYVRSHFAIKPILRISEGDDSRPTLIRRLSDAPRFTSVLSGKINTIYDLDGELL